MQELADLAGVSRATVSRALSDSALVNDETKRKIRQLARDHDYQVNQRARSFRLRKTNMIMVVVMLDVKSHQHMSDPFFLEMIGGISDALSSHDHDLILAHAPITDIANLRNGRPYDQSDGVIFIGQGQQHDRLNELAAGSKPIIVWGADLPDRDYHVVGGNNERGGYLATRHLLSMGRQQIAFFGNPSLPEIAGRYKGYIDAHQEAGISTDNLVLTDVPFEMVGARRTLRHLLDQGIRFDASVCASDVMALSAITTFSEYGLKVPDDIAIVGYDDISLAAYSSPPLTTIRQNIRSAGRQLVENLLKLTA
ncbi:MAG: LacI family DNA-binding transcriptional regulator, partial [Gammaproteobacteria bacterium]